MTVGKKKEVCLVSVSLLFFFTLQQVKQSIQQVTMYVGGRCCIIKELKLLLLLPDKCQWTKKLEAFSILTFDRFTTFWGQMTYLFIKMKMLQTKAQLSYKTEQKVAKFKSRLDSFGGFRPLQIIKASLFLHDLFQSLIDLWLLENDTFDLLLKHKSLVTIDLQVTML